ncbi:polyphosphate kinase 2 family protein [Paraconexibacter antarcticus]|uniref:Polyphosphate kinase 2 family protein n=1 Tax=Paraconexibacter antarcticus TaxID=2949664 RepID=A0ABY5DPY6_9ACTN|nr:polyphosphate kinase 2 family protein [Paraconexibacter antarcticus]UTI62847.1 polyphosphate kinase 2 family protein [Paraconexibacter antarcticus]
MAARPVSDRWRVTSRRPVDLSARDASAKTGAPGDKDATKAHTATLRARLAELQAKLYAEGSRSLLVVLQAMDAGGKDGTIRAVFEGVNPQGVKVVSFKAPTPEELAHDFLWRVHAQVPSDGDITVFNRSHYEDVLVVRVHDLVPEAVWRGRYARIRAFEELLHAEGTTIVKIMLHISAEEQKERLQERIDNPEKRWKFNPADLSERHHWDAYQEAYGEALGQTTARHAPWYVVPADRNWYRNWAVLQILVDTLEQMNPQFPPAAEGAEDAVVV